MGRRYGLPVKVETDPTSGEPCAFHWRGRVIRGEIIARWRLQDGWWVSPAEADRAGKGHSDRWYYRLLTPDHQVYELYRDEASAGLWVLDCIQD